MIGTPRHFAIAVAWFWALMFVVGTTSAFAQTRDRPPVDPVVVPTSLTPRSERLPIPPRERKETTSRDGAAGGWWFAPVGIAAALAVVGAISLAAKRLPWDLRLGSTLARDLSSIGVVGQTRLSPKHAVYLVRVGDRVLIVGAGQGGSPSTLGEVTDPAELARLVPRRAGRISPPAATTAAVRVAGQARTAGFDQRIGDDE